MSDPFSKLESLAARQHAEREELNVLHEQAIKDYNEFLRLHTGLVEQIANEFGKVVWPNGYMLFNRISIRGKPGEPIWVDYAYGVSRNEYSTQYFIGFEVQTRYTIAYPTGKAVVGRCHYRFYGLSGNSNKEYYLVGDSLTVDLTELAIKDALANLFEQHGLP